MVSALTVVALAAAGWLLRHDGTWDAYRQPLFLPCLSMAVLMTVFSTTALPADRHDWRALVVKMVLGGASLAAIAAVIVSRNPIYDLHARDVVALAALEAVSVAAAGLATEWGERYRPGTWIRTGWCATALMLVLALVPRLLLWLH